MLPYTLWLSEYSAAMVGVNLTHQSVLVHGQRMDGLNDLAGHLQLTGILDQTGPTTNFFCYGFGLLPLGGMGALHMALDMTGQNAVSALSAHGQRVLDQMLEMLVSNAALCHNYATVAMIIEFYNMVCKQLFKMGCIGL
jgi:hypothetical protein